MFAPLSDRHRPLVHAALRIAAALGFLSHGAGKLFGWFGTDAVELSSRYGVAGIIELVAGTFLLVGFATRFWAFIASGEMAVAYFWIHMAGDGSQLWWWTNRGELPFLYAFIWLLFAAWGAGPLSVDRRLEARRAGS